MGKCLVTKLAGVVNNDSLLKLGELRIAIKATEASQTLFQLKTAEYSCNVDTIAGEKNVPANTVHKIADWTDIKSKKEGEAVFSFVDKYNLHYLHSNLDVNIIGLSYLTNCIQFTVKSNTGDLISLADISNSTALTSVKLSGNITGDLASLNKCTALTSVNLSGNITGDLASLNKCTALTSVNLSGNITGDLAKVPSKMFLVSIVSTNTFTWSNRERANTLFSILRNPKVLNIDKMLQDLSNCTAVSTDQYKQITATGTRTSESDAAVQTLQSKGYTVSIAPEEGIISLT